jgi:hypothetical protein
LGVKPRVLRFFRRQARGRNKGGRIGNAACFKVAHVGWAVEKVPRLVCMGWAV